ncbi:hypothetical protein DPMN_037139 [Dreissena polymorpha]|uniref:Uncharacterized protein n=1 Tax=Dreissena polymorpha TaxID=45954 RepID=A0A9D4RNT9_DREPO|nr:hypothetical protein DPMN_037139 [Dreissena polymorpha]
MWLLSRVNPHMPFEIIACKKVLSTNAAATVWPLFRVNSHMLSEVTTLGKVLFTHAAMMTSIYIVNPNRLSQVEFVLDIFISQRFLVTETACMRSFADIEVIVCDANNNMRRNMLCQAHKVRQTMPAGVAPELPLVFAIKTAI